jgi:hypothetical protein
MRARQTDAPLQADKLDAADMWLVSLETLQMLGETESLLEELAEMEAKLADAVREWRLAGGRQGGYL